MTIDLDMQNPVAENRNSNWWIKESNFDGDDINIVMSSESLNPRTAGVQNLHLPRFFWKKSLVRPNFVLRIRTLLEPFNVNGMTLTLPMYHKGYRMATPETEVGTG